MSIGDDVRDAVDRMVAGEPLEDSPPPPTRPRPPASLGGMLDYWAEEGGGNAGLAAALGADPSNRRSREWRARMRQVERWRKGERHPSRADVRRLKKVTAASWRQTHRAELREYERDRRRWRDRLRAWLEAHPPPSRASVLTDVARSGLICEFAGLVLIAGYDRGTRSNTSIIPPANAHLGRFVAAALEERWDAAAGHLTAAWNQYYGIPHDVAWLEVDRLELEPR